MNRIVFTALVLTLLGVSVPVTAAEPEAPAPNMERGLELARLDDLIAKTDWYASRSRIASSTTRGPLLPALYVTYAALNAFDAYSTSKGLAGGATEENPFMRGVAGHRAGLWATKAGVTAGSIAIAERLWRADRKKAAIVTMVLANGMMAIVAAQNASVLRQIR
jgi:hypothetical protein